MCPFSSLTLTGKEPLVQRICSAAFPSYSGRKFRLDVAESVDIRSYWSDGSRETFVFVDLATLSKRVHVPSNGNGFDPDIRDASDVRIPDGVACVKHSIFCGKDTGLTIIVNPQTMNPALLPSTVELSRDERIVLAATAGLKSSYGGIKDLRYHEATRETGITRERWDTAKSSCIARKLLNSAGAITPDGRNAIGSTRLDSKDLRETSATPWGTDERMGEAALGDGNDDVSGL